MAKRVTCFVDGFNLYHAIADLDQPHLKWLDIAKLLRNFVDPSHHSVTSIFYFSALADWKIAAATRHRAYIAALESTGVVPVLGQFKEKSRSCKRCGAEWVGHEEKESDVNLALYLMHEAYRDSYDEAFVVTRDSDLSPALRLLRSNFPAKATKIIAPPGRGHSKELFRLATKSAAIKPIHLERSLFPERVLARDGSLVCERPQDYRPPTL